LQNASTNIRISNLKEMEMNNNNIKQLLEKYYKGFAQKKGWEITISDDFKFTVDNMKKVDINIGKSKYIEIINRFSQLYQIMRVKRMIIDNNTACVIANYDYIFPNGKVISGDVVEIWESKNEKLVSLHIFFDTLTFDQNIPK
jgi:pyruvate formate-lyase activating enzyme-like uncharacterized protein